MITLVLMVQFATTTLDSVIVSLASLAEHVTVVYLVIIL